MLSFINETSLLLEASEEGIGRFVVGALICKDERALLLKRNANDFMDGIYELPSGKVENKEGL